MLSKDEKNLSNAKSLDEATSPGTESEKANENTFPEVPEHDAVTRRLQFQQKNDIKKEKAAKKAQKAQEDAVEENDVEVKVPQGGTAATKADKQKGEQKGNGKGSGKGKKASTASATKQGCQEEEASPDIKAKKLRNPKRRAAKEKTRKQAKRAARKVRTGGSAPARPESEVEAVEEERAAGAKLGRSAKRRKAETVPEEPKSKKSSSTGKARKGKSIEGEQSRSDDSPQASSSKGVKRKAVHGDRTTGNIAPASEPASPASNETGRKSKSKGKKAKAKACIDADCFAAMKHVYTACYAGYDHGCPHCLSDHMDDKMEDLGKTMSLSVYWTRRAVGVMVSRKYLRAHGCEGRKGKSKVKQVMYFSGGPCTWANIKLAERWAPRLVC